MCIPFRPRMAAGFLFSLALVSLPLLARVERHPSIPLGRVFFSVFLDPTLVRADSVFLDLDAYLGMKQNRSSSSVRPCALPGTSSRLESANFLFGLGVRTGNYRVC